MRGREGGPALLIVDVQRHAVELGPWRGEEVLGNIGRLLRAARSAGGEVVHVQHEGEPGSELAHGSPGWEIHPAVAPERIHAHHNREIFAGRFASVPSMDEALALLEKDADGPIREPAGS